jgi:hypothetical protein
VHDMPYVRLRVFGGQGNVFVFHAPNARQVGPRGFRRGLSFHALSPF